LDIYQESPLREESTTGKMPYWLYFIAFTFAELIVSLLSPLVGVLCHCLIFVMLLVHAAVVHEEHHRKLIISLTMVPMIRIMSLSMPLSTIPQIYWYPLIYMPLLISAIVVMRITRINANQMGITLRNWPLQILIGICFGLACGVVEWVILKPKPLITEFTFAAVWLPAVILFLTTGLVEEFIFRGIMQQTSEPVLDRTGLVYVSLVFAVLHIGHLSALDVALVFVIAIFFAAIVKRTGSLLGVIIAHGITNSFLYLIGPYLLG
jgi:uncharacterized protein